MSEIDRIRKQVLRTLKLGPKSFWELINYQDGHIAVFFEVVNRLLEEGLIGYRDYRFHLRKEVPYRPFADTVCRTCGLGVELRGFWEDLYRRFMEVTRDRPLPTSDYDQGFVRPVDTVRRVAYIYQRGDLEEAEIFILGDDDLLSVAMGLTGMPRRIVVVEIDRRINRFIQDFARRENLPWIEVYDYNVIEALPEGLKRAFDVFVTDPVETKKGLKLFVGRCLEALKGPGAVGYMGFTHREASLRKWFEFEKFILSAGLVITDILRDFAIYPERENQWEHFYETYEIMKKLELPLPEVDWYKSSFVRFEVVEGPRVPEFEPPKDLRELYFDEESWATPLPSYLKENS